MCCTKFSKFCLCCLDSLYGFVLIKPSKTPGNLFEQGSNLPAGAYSTEQRFPDRI